MVAVGVLSSISLGIRASALMPAITILAGGLVATAINALLLLAASKFIYLFIDVEEDLSRIAALLGKEPED